MPTATASTLSVNNSSNEVEWMVWNVAYTACTNATTVANIYYDCGTAATTWQGWNTQEPPAAAPEVEARAESLLRSFLTAEQEQSWERDSQFDVMVEGGDRAPRHYRIKKGTIGNIKRLEGGRIVESLCVHPTKVPAPDVHLAQLLHLLHDEAGLRRKANITAVAA